MKNADYTYLNIQEGGSLRMDCPLCLNRNTLSIRKLNGKLMWNCFHVSCEHKGRDNQGYTAEEMRYVFNKKDTGESKPFEIPKSFVSVYPNPNAMKYLSAYNVSPYECGARIVYDVKQDRVVFLIDIDGIVYGAVGRSLSNKNPRWFKYNTCKFPFVVGNITDTAVIVEDCVSACSVSAIHTGVAIMGTTLTDDHTNFIKSKFKKVFICLDPDANGKTFDIQKKLGYSIDTRIILIPKDLKYLTTEKIRELLI